MRALFLAAIAFVLWLLFRSQSTGNASEIPFSDASDGGSGNSALDDFMQGISLHEKSNPNYNNPGAIKTPRRGPWEGQVGVAGNGLAIFSDQGDGWGALQSLVTTRSSANPDWNFYQWFNYYLRGSTNAYPVDAQGDSNSYAEGVAGYMGVDPNMPVAQALGV